MTTNDIATKFNIPHSQLLYTRRYVNRTETTVICAYERDTLTSDEWRDITQQVQVELELGLINKKLRRSKEDDDTAESPNVAE